MPEYTLPDLPYDDSALEPHISGRVVQLHHDTHHQAYVTGADTTLEQLAQVGSSGKGGSGCGEPAEDGGEVAQRVRLPGGGRGGDAVEPEQAGVVALAAPGAEGRAVGVP